MHVNSSILSAEVIKVGLYDSNVHKSDDNDNLALDTEPSKE